MSVEKIRELKQLLDEGLITQEEFDKQKTGILNKPNNTIEFPEGMDLKLIQNKTGIALILFFVSMFLPWFDFFFTASGWKVANIADRTSEVVYLVYFIPLGAIIGLKSLLAKNPLNGFVKITGLVPTVLLIGMIVRLSDAGASSEIIEQLFNVIGFGFWLSFICGWIIVTSSENAE